MRAEKLPAPEPRETHPAGGKGLLRNPVPPPHPHHLQAKLRLEMEMERMRQTHSKEVESRDEEVEEARQSCQKKVREPVLSVSRMNPASPITALK